MSQTSSNMDIGVAVRRNRSPLELLAGMLPLKAVAPLSTEPEAQQARADIIKDAFKTYVSPMPKMAPFVRRPSTCDQASPLMIRTTQVFQPGHQTGINAKILPHKDQKIFRQTQKL